MVKTDWKWRRIHPGLYRLEGTDLEVQRIRRGHYVVCKGGSHNVADGLRLLSFAKAYAEGWAQADVDTVVLTA